MSTGASVAEIAFAMRAFGGLDRILATGAFPDLTAETADAIVAEADRFAEAEFLPLNRVGDREGARFADGTVATAPGWKDAFRRWAAAGWNGIGSPVEWGGQGLPVLVQMAVQEIWNAANTAFAVGPMLTTGAVHALLAHAEDDLKARFLPRLVSGAWMATMNLTEPHAGSDLGALRARAERAADGSYRLFGQKIFITYGEHDLTDNIVHLVLARLGDAPPGTKGISMFLVPKVLDDGRRNDVFAVGVEHKLGLHGSPTCTMAFGARGDGATGWLIGEENRGLACMFTMMNFARLSVGIQGVGLAARACRQATDYARERRQGRAPGTAGGMSPIAEHPDVQRELLRAMALTAASRAIAYACAEALDMSVAAPAAERQRWGERASLITPVAKAFGADTAVAAASANIQVHGGAGYIEETGAAQFLRDARILSVYEGTNGIQAVDLVTRKLKLADGEVMSLVLDEIRQAAAAVGTVNGPEFGLTAERLRTAAGDLATAAAFLAKAIAQGRQRTALAGASPFLRLFGLAFGGALLAKGAVGANGTDRGGAIALARFHAESLMPETTALRQAVVEGAEGLEQAARHLVIAGLSP